MININSIKERIIEETTQIVMEKYNLSSEEIKVSFKNDGDIKISIAPKELLKNLKVNLTVENEEE